VATISALPAVASALSASLPKVLERITEQEAKIMDIRIKLGSFLREHYDKIRDRLLYLELLRESGNQVSVQRGYESPPLHMPSDDILNIKTETEPIAAEDLPQLRGIVALGLSQGESWWIVNRTLSIQLADVTSNLDNIGSRTAEILELLNNFIDEVR